MGSKFLSLRSYEFRVDLGNTKCPETVFCTKDVVLGWVPALLISTSKQLTFLGGGGGSRVSMVQNAARSVPCYAQYLLGGPARALMASLLHCGLMLSLELYFKKRL